MEDLRGKIEGLGQELEKEERLRKELQKEEIDLKERANRAEMEYARMLDKFEERIGGLQRDLVDSKGEATRWRGLKESLDKELRDAQSNFSHQLNQQALSISQLEESLRQEQIRLREKQDNLRESRDENRELHQKIMELTTGKKVLELQIDSLRGQQIENTLSLTRENLDSDAKSKLENDHWRSRFKESERTIQNLREEVCKARVDKEKASARVEGLVEENAFLREQVSRLRERLGQERQERAQEGAERLERFDKATERLAQEFEGRNNRLERLEKSYNNKTGRIRSKSRSRSKQNRERDRSYSPSNNVNIPTNTTIVDDRPIRPAKSNQNIQGGTGMSGASKEFTTKTSKKRAEEMASHVFDGLDQKLNPSSSLSSMKTQNLKPSSPDLKNLNESRFLKKMQQKQNSNILTWDNPYQEQKKASPIQVAPQMARLVKQQPAGQMNFSNSLPKVKASQEIPPTLQISEDNLPVALSSLPLQALDKQLLSLNILGDKLKGDLATIDKAHKKTVSNLKEKEILENRLKQTEKERALVVKEIRERKGQK